MDKELFLPGKISLNVSIRKIIARRIKEALLSLLE
jgi:hypothetical protein